tara:strand:- start:310 stop:477 length:168 start_codon:yes stop_codon:yes gene_type:complete
MFRLFKRKTETEKLQNRYKKLMAEWHDLSSIDRSASDAKYAEAQKVLDQLDELTH